jgi:hypothetical protein
MVPTLGELFRLRRGSDLQLNRFIVNVYGVRPLTAVTEIRLIAIRFRLLFLATCIGHEEKRHAVGYR